MLRAFAASASRHSRSRRLLPLASASFPLSPLARAMSTLADEFARKVALSKSLPPLNDNAAKLEMYALFKQANAGRNATPKPGMLDFVGKAKWEAWTKLGDMSKDEAMSQYIAIIDSLAKQHGADSPQAAAAAPTSATEDLLVSVSESGLLTIQLNRPTRHNALNRAMYAGIVSALESAAAQDRVKAVLIQAAGATFSSGNDLSMFTEQPDGVSFEAMADAGAALLTGFVDALVTFPKPVVAAVQGPAVGIAVTMLALCDLVYVSETVTLQTPFTALGQTPEACSSVLFPRIMGPARANALLLLGEKLTAQDAVACGLATSVLSVGDFDQRVQEKVDLLLTRYPIAMAQSKALIRTPELVSELQTANRREAETLKKMWLGPECMDAVLKFQARKK